MRFFLIDRMHGKVFAECIRLAGLPSGSLDIRAVHEGIVVMATDAISSFVLVVCVHKISDFFGIATRYVDVRVVVAVGDAIHIIEETSGTGFFIEQDHAVVVIIYGRVKKAIVNVFPATNPFCPDISALQLT